MEISGGESSTVIKKTEMEELDLEIKKIEEAEKVALQKRSKVASQLFDWALDSVIIMAGLNLLIFKGKAIICLYVLEFIVLIVFFIFFRMYSVKSPGTKIKKILFWIFISLIGGGIIISMLTYK